MMDIVRALEVTRKLVDGPLVDGGQQYSVAVDTTTLDVDVVIFAKTFDVPYKALYPGWDLLELELNLALELRAVSSATADLKWKAQARNKDGTWVDLFSEVTETDIGAAYVAKNRSGDISIVTNLNLVPFDLQVLLQCNETNEGRGRIANSSWVRMLMRNSNF